MKSSFLLWREYKIRIEKKGEPAQPTYWDRLKRAYFASSEPAQHNRPILCSYTFCLSAWIADMRPLARSRVIGPLSSKLVDRHRDTLLLLRIGNAANPVTPLRNAAANALHHEGSRVLVQDSPGQYTGPGNPSKCTFEVIRSFFANGIFPQNGKICSPDHGPWDNV